MPFRALNTGLLAALLAFVATHAGAQVGGQNAEQVILTARPGLCVLKDANTKECVMGVLLEWRAPIGNYCLQQRDLNGPLKCWQQASEGAHKQALVATNDVVFYLHSAPSGEPLAEVPVRVLSLAQKRPERRRRRHAWAPL